MKEINSESYPKGSLIFGKLFCEVDYVNRCKIRFNQKETFASNFSSRLGPEEIN